ncbi:TPA: helix-turn-helix domain-containing protein [Serratia marcescens]|nr:helix-turn-helix domain-containing protein [Serratia marcescens]
MAVPSVSIVVTPGFSPFHFSVPCIIFGEMLADEPLFDLRICALQAGVIRSDLGMSLEVSDDLTALQRADIIVIPFWPHPEERPDAALIDALNAAYRRGAQIVGLCLGTYVLAYAGLLDHRRAATHWENEADFSTRFPQVQLDANALYVSDERLITSAGTAAGLDCCLHVVRQHYGSATANRLARRMVIPPHRDGGQAQFIARPLPATTQDQRINRLLVHLRERLAQPHDLDTLARFAAMSRRTFTRHFQQATGMSVGEWLNTERLLYSQELLESTRHPISTIAALAGFQSDVSFRQRFKQRFAVSPSEWRRTFQPPGASG